MIVIAVVLDVTTMPEQMSWQRDEVMIAVAVAVAVVVVVAVMSWISFRKRRQVEARCVIP